MSEWIYFFLAKLACVGLGAALPLGVAEMCRTRRRWWWICSYVLCLFTAIGFVVTDRRGFFPCEKNVELPSDKAVATKRKE